MIKIRIGILILCIGISSCAGSKNSKTSTTRDIGFFYKEIGAQLDGLSIQSELPIVEERDSLIRTKSWKDPRDGSVYAIKDYRPHFMSVVCTHGISWERFYQIYKYDSGDYLLVIHAVKGTSYVFQTLNWNANSGFTKVNASTVLPVLKMHDFIVSDESGGKHGRAPIVYVLFGEDNLLFATLETNGIAGFEHIQTKPIWLTWTGEKFTLGK